MEIQSIIKKAVSFIEEVYKNSNVQNIRLEEIDTSSNPWKITIGYDVPNEAKSVGLGQFASGSIPKFYREYKTLEMDKKTYDVINMKIYHEAK